MNALRRILLVFRREMGFHPAIADMQRRHRFLLVTVFDQGFLAPRQEFRIVLDVFDQIEHLPG